MGTTEQPSQFGDSLFGGLDLPAEKTAQSIRRRSFGLLVNQIPQGVEDIFTNPDELIEFIRRFFEKQLQGKRVIPIMKRKNTYSDPTGKLREHLDRLYGSVVHLEGTSTSDLLGGYFDSGIVSELQPEEDVYVSWFIYHTAIQNGGSIEDDLAESADISHLKGIIQKEEGYISALYKVVVNRFIDRLTGVGTMRIVDAIEDTTDKDILFVDIKSFKLINDTYDHDVGDRAIQHFSDAIRDCLQLRRGEYIVRKGGDEFIVITPTGARKRMEGFMERLEAYLHQHPFEFVHKGKSYSLILEAVSASHIADGVTTTTLAIKKLSDDVTEAGGGAVYKSGKRLAETARKAGMTREDFLSALGKAWDDTEKVDE